MSRPPQRFSGSWIINSWFEDEAELASARRRRLAQAAAGIALSLALLVGFGALAYFSAGRATSAAVRAGGVPPSAPGASR